MWMWASSWWARSETWRLSASQWSDSAATERMMPLGVARRGERGEGSQLAAPGLKVANDTKGLQSARLASYRRARRPCSSALDA